MARLLLGTVTEPVAILQAHVLVTYNLNLLDIIAIWLSFFILVVSTTHFYKDKLIF